MSKIRQAKEEDVKVLVEIEAVCFPKEEAAKEEDLYQRFQAFPENFFVAEEDGKIVGFINGCTTDQPELPDELYHDAFLHNPNGAYQTVFGLDVHPDYQRRGIAAELMQHFIQVNKERGRKGIVLTCKDHLVHYYEKFGYVFQGVSESTHGGAVWNDMRLDYSENEEKVNE